MTALPFGEIARDLEARDCNPVPIRPDGKVPAPDKWQVGGPVARWSPRHARCVTGLLTRRTPAAEARRPETAEQGEAAATLPGGPLAGEAWHG